MDACIKLSSYVVSFTQTPVPLNVLVIYLKTNKQTNKISLHCNLLSLTCVDFDNKQWFEEQRKTAKF